MAIKVSVATSAGPLLDRGESWKDCGNF